MSEESKPYKVFRVFDGPARARHYRELIERSRVDLSHLRPQVEEAERRGYEEAPVGQFATEDEAQEYASERNARYNPGVSYQVERLDVGDIFQQH